MKESGTKKGHKAKKHETKDHGRHEKGIELAQSKPKAYFYNNDGQRVDLELDKPARGDRFVASVGPIGGIHKDVNNRNDEYYVKRETTFGTVRPGQVIAEFVAGGIFHDIYPDSFPEINLAVDATQQDIPDKTGQYVYVASKMFQGYKPLHEELGYNNRPKSLTAKDKAKLNEYLKDSDEFVKGSIIRKLFGDDDAHIGNKLVKHNPKTGKYDIKDIDFGTAFLGIKGKLDPHASREQPMPWPHSHYINDYPRDLHTTKKTVEVIKEHGKIDFKAKIAEKMEVVTKIYGVGQLVEFAKYVGMKNASKIISSENTEEMQKEKLSKAITKFLGNKLQSRQKALEKYGAQIELGLILKDYYKTRTEHPNLEIQEFGPFKKWVNENQEYAFDIAVKRKHVHFRHKEFTVTESYNQLERLVLWLLSLIGIEPTHYKTIHNGIGQVLEDQGKGDELRKAGYKVLTGEETQKEYTEAVSKKGTKVHEQVPEKTDDSHKDQKSKNGLENYKHTRTKERSFSKVERKQGHTTGDEPAIRSH